VPYVGSYGVGVGTEGLCVRGFAAGGRGGVGCGITGGVGRGITGAVGRGSVDDGAIGRESGRDG